MYISRSTAAPSINSALLGIVGSGADSSNTEGPRLCPDSTGVCLASSSRTSDLRF